LYYAVAVCDVGISQWSLVFVTTAMIYKAFEYAADTVELENVLKFDQATPILASAATGIFYKSTGTSMHMLLGFVFVFMLHKLI
jgi:hypothetical protein